jgi:hypothetical protein
MRVKGLMERGNEVVTGTELVEAEGEEANLIEIEGWELEVGTKIKVIITITHKITKIITNKKTIQIKKEKTKIFPNKNLDNKITINN